MNREDEFESKIVAESTESRTEKVKKDKEKLKDLIEESNHVIVIAGNSESEEMTSQIVSHNVNAHDIMASISAVEKLHTELVDTLEKMMTGEIG